MSYRTCRNAYRRSYHRARYGTARRAKQGFDGLLAGLVLAIIMSIVII
ncbi:hypothetical protein [uncultured Salinicola sp.]|nr:hypothetical protein [uncultured Salinicola sp.]